MTETVREIRAFRESGATGWKPRQVAFAEFPPERGGHFKPSSTLTGEQALVWNAVPTKTASVVCSATFGVTEQPVNRKQRRQA